MLYLFDQAVCDNLKASLTDELNKNVFITDADNYPGILAQIQNDTITYPLLLLHRDEDTPINTDLINFSRYKFGVPCVFDNKTNNIYYEKALPIDVSYTLRILSHNVADTDELGRELFFKYLSMFFLTIQAPYESDRKMRFGIEVDRDYGIKKESGGGEYLSSGTLYQSTIHLKTSGCVYLTYTPRHLQRTVIDMKKIGIENPTPTES